MINEDILKYLPPDMLAAYKKVETLKNYHEIMKRISKGLSSEQTEEEFTKERRAEDQNFNNIKNIEESETMIDYKKKYEEAIENFKKIKADNKDNKELVDFIEYEYPELKENMDEKIRKELIKVFEERVKLCFEWKNGIPNNAVLAWLEKQGERKPQGKSALEAAKEEKVDNQNCVKPADKTEPRFKVDDWVIDKQGIVHQIANVIENVTNHTYGYDIVGGGYFNDNTKGVRLWTIQDAKDGDVLLFEGYYNSIVLFQGIGINGKERINYHCKCDLGDYSFGVQGDVAYLGTIEENAEHYHPATKEQRNILFSKMKKAGYEWDAEKKELKKIEQNLTWSEEDESHMGHVLSYLESFKAYNIPHIEPIKKEIDWLKSLKDRMKGE